MNKKLSKWPQSKLIRKKATGTAMGHVYVHHAKLSTMD